MLPGPVQLVNVTEVTFPRGLVRPLPDFAVPAVVMARQVTTVPVAVSCSAGLLAFPVMDPPGFTVQVLAVLAPDDAAPRLTVRATAAVATSPLPMSFLMWIRSSSG